MKTLIPLVKSDRLREIYLYKSKDYSFRSGENKYVYIRKMKVIIDTNEYCFQIRDNQSEQKFFIAFNSSCIFLSIIEIYDLLRQISSKIGTNKVKTILTGKRNKSAKIEYTELEFELMFFTNKIPEGKILLPESNLEISYEYLFVLIALIQDKSNYLWMLSNKINHKYINGILRLLTCLISTKQNEFLKKLRWDYDTLNNKYYINESIIMDEHITTKDINGKDIIIKYYLTKKQFVDIMKVRNPSNFVNDGGTLR